jgi:FkbM family methyltransferase
MIKLDHNYFKYYKPKQNDVWIDLGATIGEICILNKNLILEKNITVICIEPNPYAYIALSKWCLENIPNNVILLNTGIWHSNVTEIFNITNNIWCNMFDIHGHDVSYVAKDMLKIQCPLLSLDTIIDIIGKDISFLKADIEGAEIEVFKNCKQISKIKNMAIAAYHPIKDHKETWEVLKPFFENKYKIVIKENISYNGFPGYSMLYTNEVK